MRHSYLSRVALQLSFVPLCSPWQVQVNVLLEVETDVGFPASQRFEFGGEEKDPPSAEPQAPSIGEGTQADLSAFGSWPVGHVAQLQKMDKLLSMLTSVHSEFPFRHVDPHSIISFPVQFGPDVEIHASPSGFGAVPEGHV